MASAQHIGLAYPLIVSDYCSMFGKKRKVAPQIGLEPTCFQLAFLRGRNPRAYWGIGGDDRIRTYDLRSMIHR